MVEDTGIGMDEQTKSRIFEPFFTTQIFLTINNMKSNAANESDLQVENRQLKKMLAAFEKEMAKTSQAETLLKNTLQELQIHQEELRTQNENLIQAQEEIERTNRKYQDLFNFAPVGFFNFDPLGKILEVNLTGAELLGRYRIDLVGRSFRTFLDRKSRPIFTEHLRRMLSGDSASDTIWLEIKGKPSFPAEIVSSAFGPDTGRAVFCRSAIKDISKRHRAEIVLRSAHQKLEQANEDLRKEIEERLSAEEALRRSEQQLRTSLREKEVLLQEIHHRVKNNMQVISSLLNLQAAGSNDAKLKQSFRESCSRINAMALVHEMLYQSDSLSRIDLNVFVTDVTSGLVEMYKIRPSRINIHIRAEHIFLGIDQAIPCGLVINELISNAFKYAFPEHTGEINIDISLTAEDEVDLIIRDNGAGMPPDFNLRDSKTLGLKLVWGLVESQLGGKVAVDNEQGTRFTIRFPRALPQKGRTFRI